MPPKTRKIAVMGFRAVGILKKYEVLRIHVIYSNIFALGKSSLVIRFVEDQFVDSYHPSIENSIKYFLCTRKLITYTHSI